MPIRGSELGTTVDAISDRVSPSRVVERRKQKLTAGLTAARDSIMGSAADVQASVKAAGEAGHQLPDAAAKKTQGAPLVAGSMAFGLGFLAAAIFPGSDTEAQLAGKAQEIASLQSRSSSSPVKRRWVPSESPYVTVLSTSKRRRSPASRRSEGQLRMPSTKQRTPRAMPAERSATRRRSRQGTSEIFRSPRNPFRKQLHSHFRQGAQK